MTKFYMPQTLMQSVIELIKDIKVDIEKDGLIATADEVIIRLEDKLARLTHD